MRCQQRWHNRVHSSDTDLRVVIRRDDAPLALETNDLFDVLTGKLQTNASTHPPLLAECDHTETFKRSKNSSRFAFRRQPSATLCLDARQLGNRNPRRNREFLPAYTGECAGGSDQSSGYFHLRPSSLRL